MAARTGPGLAARPLGMQEFPFRSTSDPVEVICDRLRANKLHRDLAEMLEEGVRLNREDAHEALNHFRSSIASLTAQHVVTRDMDLTQTTQETLAEYKRVNAGHGLLGTPWPWEALNKATLGIQDEELIFFYARPKSGKAVPGELGTTQ
jgi:replicative DNA helicase